MNDVTQVAVILRCAADFQKMPVAVSVIGCFRVIVTGYENRLLARLLHKQRVSVLLTAYG